MTDPLILFLVAIVSGVVCVLQTIIHCSDAELHGNRLWWRKALFRARQRTEYKEFCSDAERSANAQKQYAQQHEGEE